jgi:hypothetical protein
MSRISIKFRIAVFFNENVSDKINFGSSGSNELYNWHFTELRSFCFELLPFFIIRGNSTRVWYALTNTVEQMRTLFRVEDPGFEF